MSDTCEHCGAPRDEQPLGEECDQVGWFCQSCGGWSLQTADRTADLADRTARLNAMHTGTYKAGE